MSDVEEGAVSEEEEEVEEETPRSQDGEEEEPEKPGSSVSRTSRATKSAVSNKLSRYLWFCTLLTHFWWLELTSRPVSVASRASGWKDLADAASIKTDTTEGDTNDLLTGGTEPPKGCWHTFSRCIGGNNQNLRILHSVVYTFVCTPFVGMWASREMDTSRDREIYVRTTIRELVVYIIFLTVLCICKCILDPFWN